MNRRAEHFDYAKGKERIVTNFRGLVEDAEALVKATRDFSGEGLAAARSRLENQIEHVRDVLAETGGAAAQQARRAARETDRYVHDRPWQAMGMAMAAGILIGWLSRGR